MNPPDATSQPVSSGLARTLRVLAVLSALLALTAAFAGMLDVSSLDPAEVFAWPRIARLAGWCLAAVSICGALLGLAALIDATRQRAAAAAQSATPAPAASTQPAFPPDNARVTAPAPNPRTSEPVIDDTMITPPGITPTQWQELMALIHDIRDNLLLNESERVEKRTRVVEEDVARAISVVRPLLEDGQFVPARQVIQELARRYPKHPEVHRLNEQLDEARRRAEEADVTAYTKRAEELMSISAWDRATSVAAELLDRHPDNENAKQLAARVRRERDLFRAEQAKRMYAEVERFSRRRRWREALEAARAYVERFPDTQEAQILRVQMTTLEANAEIQERQALEQQITDFAKHGRYIEAYNLALHLIQTFPESPQADALRKQLVRLKELAHNPDATPARVKVDG